MAWTIFMSIYIEEKTNNLFRNLHFNLLENKIEKKEKEQ